MYVSKYPSVLRHAANQWLFERYGKDLERIIHVVAREKRPTKEVRNALFYGSNEQYKNACQELLAECCHNAFRLDLALKFRVDGVEVISGKETTTQALTKLQAAADADAKAWGQYLLYNVVRRLFRDMIYNTYQAQDSDYITPEDDQSTLIPRTAPNRITVGDKTVDLYESTPGNLMDPETHAALALTYSPEDVELLEEVVAYGRSKGLTNYAKRRQETKAQAQEALKEILGKAEALNLA